MIIAVENEDVLPLYVTHGVYGKKLWLGLDDEPNQDVYVRTLAEYACCRQDDHVFFHSQGRFFYGGQIRGASSHGAFYLNGRRGFLERRAEAPLV